MSARATKRTPRTRGAKQHPRPAPAPAASELKPFKIVGTLIGARYDEKGHVVGEEQMGQITIYAPQFSQLETLIQQGIAQARAEQNGGAKTPAE